MNVAIASIIGLSLSAATATAAPVQLYNKTITISWVENTVQRAPDGRTNTPQINSSRMVYVSNAGRLFIRGNRNINMKNFQGGKSGDKAPSDRASSGGNLTFQGNQLVGTAVYDGGARRVTVGFDPSFGTCTANVVYGKTGAAPQKWKGFDGITYELLQVNVGAVNCSIRDGNAFAS